MGIVGEVLFSSWDSKIQTALRKISNDRLRDAETSLADATERAAKLEKEAADARGRVADIERITAWRRISAEQLDIISTSLRSISDDADVLIEYERSNPEAYLYSVQFLTVLATAGVKKLRHMGNSHIPNIMLGVYLSASERLNGRFISDAFTKAHVSIILVQKDLSTHLSRNGKR